MKQISVRVFASLFSSCWLWDFYTTFYSLSAMLCFSHNWKLLLRSFNNLILRLISSFLFFFFSKAIAMHTNRFRLISRKWLCKNIPMLNFNDIRMAFRFISEKLFFSFFCASMRENKGVSHYRCYQMKWTLLTESIKQLVLCEMNKDLN